MMVEYSKEKQIDNIFQVKTKGRMDQETINLSKSNIALHIGKQDSHHDFLISFSECSTLIRGECKFSESGGTIVFSGQNTKDSFWSEQKKVSESKCKLKYNYFFFTN